MINYKGRPKDYMEYFSALCSRGGAWSQISPPAVCWFECSDGWIIDRLYCVRVPVRSWSQTAWAQLVGEA